MTRKNHLKERIVEFLKEVPKDCNTQKYVILLKDIVDPEKSFRYSNLLQGSESKIQIPSGTFWKVTCRVNGIVSLVREFNDPTTMNIDSNEWSQEQLEEEIKKDKSKRKRSMYQTYRIIGFVKDNEIIEYSQNFELLC